ncbi:peptidoglycan-binding domain-containing protein [Streptomyces melanogenes]|uniref:peptidoglycan-binding domain-containing protein n=1 Tax=Streptomyces melanogenes TaxID=67326 RepID=UPI00167EBCBB|nr:peptidoglycan-binding domain-containing protein [Streptomyces melanogenes]GGP82499.1 hypothetical protein GCM10010278_71440 [Streptomyces melanogenes]
MRTRTKTAAVAALTALTGTALTGTALGASPPRAEPYCNYIDDSARPIIRERPPHTQTPGAVPQVQCLINTYSNQAGPLTVDGILGPTTRAAIRSVQRCNQVSEPAGILVGPSTWEVLYSPIPGCARPL